LTYHEKSIIVISEGFETFEASVFIDVLAGILLKETIPLNCYLWIEKEIKVHLIKGLLLTI